MNNIELLLAVLEINRRIQKFIEKEGFWFEFDIDYQEWTLPQYFHQN